MKINYCPVLKPSIKDFKNFHQYVESLDKQFKSKVGMVKIVPPSQWSARKSDYTNTIEDFVIPGPIQQNTYGKGGVYQCLHIQKKSLSYKQYKKKTLPFDKITDGKSAEQVEDLFWKNIAFSPPLYGADIQVSLMEPCSDSWNLGNLQSLLTYVLQSPLDGINKPYCYVGSWKTLFAWHTQDLQLSAINYVHSGKSKFWYSIPQHQHYILQKEARSLFSEHFSKCSEYLRHKTTLINPYYLKNKYPQLDITKVQQRPGEFVLVFGGAYHCGFNFGFNLAQAVNYATLGWLRQFALAKSCKCRKDSVKISHTSVFERLSESRFKNCKEVKEFKELIKQELQQNKDSPDIRSIIYDEISMIRKGLKKIRKYKMHIKGEDYQINRWYQCDKCNKWRRTRDGKYDLRLRKEQNFYCWLMNMKCKTKQEGDEEFMTVC